MMLQPMLSLRKKDLSSYQSRSQYESVLQMQSKAVSVKTVKYPAWRSEQTSEGMVPDNKASVNFSVKKHEVLADLRPLSTSNCRIPESLPRFDNLPMHSSDETGPERFIISNRLSILSLC
jgi:hypothetical protein